MIKNTIVDTNDKVIGAEYRDVVRTKGLIHRIVRIFIINNNGKILLQKRRSDLKDNPGKWDQSVGGHVDEAESYQDAAQRETNEELGIKINKFIKIGYFYIERPDKYGYIRRFQTIFVGRWNGPVKFEVSEIAEVKWFTAKQIDEWLNKSPNDFTKNFGVAFKDLTAYLKN